jgi:hypothetical protein
MKIACQRETRGEFISGYNTIIFSNYNGLLCLALVKKMI